MIRVYQPATEKNPTYGFTFDYYATMSIGTQHVKYSDLPTAELNFELAKMDCIAFNLEFFWHFCHDNIVPGSEIYPDAMRTLRDTVQKANDRQINYDHLLADIVEKANFMRTLVKGITAKIEKEKAIMVAFNILRFCKDEISERETNTSKDEHSDGQG